MVLLAAKLTSGVYALVNEKSEPVGEVRRPREFPIVGYGQGTVYLDRRGSQGK